MKKSIAILISLILLFSVCLTACTGGDGINDNDTSKNPSEEADIGSSTSSESDSDSASDQETESNTDVNIDTDTDTDTDSDSSTVKQYIRMDADGTENANGEYVLFGTYPQAEVTDTALISALNTEAGTLPIDGENGNWTSYKYYQGTRYVGSQSNAIDYMWYIDITYGEDTYRGVYFTSYRPYTVMYDNTYSVQDDNGYFVDTVYWFKFEPIKWKILTENNNNALILCEMLIDSQAYQNTYTLDAYYYVTDADGNVLTDESGDKIYASKYAYSTIREWLNDNFYNTAFNELQKEIIQLTNVDNSISTQGYSSYGSQNTEDNVFLLCLEDTRNSEYGFSNDGAEQDVMKQKQLTDYAVCQGADVKNEEGCGSWWLRSPSLGNSENASMIFYNGTSSSGSVGQTYYGICPALWISL